MARSSLRSLPASKGVAAIGAAVLMVGGGVAAAQNVLPGQQDAGSPTQSEAVTDEAPEELGDEAPEVTSEEDADLVTETAPEQTPDPGGDEATEDGGDEAPQGIIEETPEQAYELPQEAPGENVVEGSPGGDERSETAKRVHEALSGDPDVSPGHPEFGAKVSERARDGGLGAEVSRAARGVDAGSGGDQQDDGSRHGNRASKGASGDDRPGGGPPAWANNDGEKATPPGRR